MNRLDAIKARAKVVATKPENREATYAEFGAVLRLACFDIPALVAAVEAVLALHYRDVDDLCRDCCYNWPCPTVAAIRTALGDGDDLEPYMPVDDPGCDCEGCDA